jgi:Skp family chaperone for outer membrane proteins
MQTKLQDKQTEIQFLTNKLQTKAQETQQAVIAALSPSFQQILGELIQAQELEMVVTPEALFYADPDLDITDEVTALLDLAASKSEE